MIFGAQFSDVAIEMYFYTYFEYSDGEKKRTN